jgi:hypothetical protein
MMRTFWAPRRSLRRRRPCAAPVGGAPGGTHGAARPAWAGTAACHHATERDAGSWRCAADRAAEIRLLEACPIARYQPPLRVSWEPRQLRGRCGRQRRGSAKIEQRDGVPSQSLYLSGRIVPLMWQRARWHSDGGIGRRTLAGVIREGVIGEAQTGMARRALSEWASARKRGSNQRSTGPFRHPRSFAYRPGGPICRDQLPALFQECSE